MLLAAAGAFIIRRNVARPLAEITRVTEAVAAGTATAIPYGARRDEIGALARSIAVFQDAMRHNKELSDTVLGDAEARARRQEQIAAEIEPFSADVEAGSPSLATSPIRCSTPRPSSPAPPTARRSAPRAPPPRRRKRRTMCATSRPPPTSWPPR